MPLPLVNLSLFQVVQILNELPWLAAAGQRVPCHWTYPKDVLNKCRLFAFRRLRKEGYFIGEGRCIIIQWDRARDRRILNDKQRMG